MCSNAIPLEEGSRLLCSFKDYSLDCSNAIPLEEGSRPTRFLIFICLEKFGQKAYKYKKVVSFMEEHKKTDRKIIQKL